MHISGIRDFIIPRYYPFFLYLAMIFFVTIGDSGMAYYAPVVMERHFASSTMMGLILSTSSVCGMIMDFTFARLFGNKKSFFFNKLLFGLVFFFPLAFFVPHSIPSFVFAMVIWGAYFEAIFFSNYHAVHEHIDRHHHAWAWGLISMIKGIGWSLGPLIANELEQKNGNYPLYVTIGFFGIAFLLFVVRMVVQRYSRAHVQKPTVPALHHTFSQELKVWFMYGRVLWPLLAILFVVYLVDAAFFSVGTVFTEHLSEGHPLGALFIGMYTIPSVIFSVLAIPFAKMWGKKRAAFIFGALMGLGLVLMSQVSSLILILVLTFLLSAAGTIMFTELSAVFEDYVARSGKFDNDLIGLTAVMGSFGYIVGPPISGVLGDVVGPQRVFGFWGALLLGLCVCSFFLVKRKIRLPFRKTEEILEAT